jgi:salicylate hydroxylase
VPATAVPPEFREPLVHLWLGLDAHLVHYPVKGGRLINIVGIVHDQWNETGWSAEGSRDEIMRHFARWAWADKARDLVAIPDQWLKWALYDRKAPFRGGVGPVTLIGDAAHPMLPFLAQGAGMAIEDAAVLADHLARDPDDPTAAMRRYERARRRRTARVQRAARSNGRVYHLKAGEAVLRNLFLRMAGGKLLLRRYNWLYDWRTVPPGSASPRRARLRSNPGED